jgi:hypothetical protein
MKWNRLFFITKQRAMEGKFYNEESLVRYLLGQLGEEEQSRVEEKYFADKEWFEQLEVVESDLIDSYVCQRLSGKDLQAFENCFLQSPERRQRVAFAQALQQFVEKQPQSKANQKIANGGQSFWSFAGLRRLTWLPASVAFLLLLGCFWLAFDNARLRNRLQQAQTGADQFETNEQELEEKLRQQRQEAEQLAQELKNQRDNRLTQDPSESGLQTAIAQIIPFTLNANAVRSSGGIQKLEMPADTRFVRLTMIFAYEQKKEIEANLKRVGGQEILQRARLKTRANGAKAQVIWALPAKSLDEADYIITINGTDESGAVIDVERYAFRIIKK